MQIQLRYWHEINNKRNGWESFLWCVRVKCFKDRENTKEKITEFCVLGYERKAVHTVQTKLLWMQP